MPNKSGTTGDSSIRETGGVVTATGLNVRYAAGTEHPKITRITNGQKLTIHSFAYASDGSVWYEVTAKVGSLTYRGYVHSDYVKTDVAYPLTEANNSGSIHYTGTVAATEDIPVSFAHTYAYAGHLTGDQVNLRKGPGTSNESIAKISKGTPVVICGQAAVGDIIWYHIATIQNGKVYEGYMSGTYICADIAGSGIWSTVNTEGITLRREAKSDATAVTGADGKARTLRKGEFAYIVGEVQDGSVKWMRVKVADGDKIVTGYISGKYLQWSDEGVKGPFAPDAGGEDFAKQMRDAGFPESYIPYLTALHEQHPQWKFTPYQTKLDWSAAITGENTLGNNLIETSAGRDWLSYAEGAYDYTTDKSKPFDGSNWVMISAAGLSYYMDPRNWLTESYIFMFEDLRYDPKTQTREGVENILKGTAMYKTTFTYKDASGATKTILYSQAFMDAAEYSGVNPYHLASRVKQEVVTGSGFSRSATGTVEGFEGYYNFYNIGAYNSTASMGAIKNGLKFARYGSTNASMNKASLIPWNNRYNAIVGGAYYIGSTYINRGQNTIYLQKYNVTGTSRFSHQYMSNAKAPRSEALKVYQAYKGMAGYDDMALTFSIPVYTNMPKSAVAAPSGVATPNAYLSKLTVTTDAGKTVTLSPSFAAGVYEYTVKVPSGTKAVTVAATPVRSAAKVSGTGKHTLSGKETSVVVTVTAENGTVSNVVIKVKTE